MKTVSNLCVNLQDAHLFVHGTEGGGGVEEGQQEGGSYLPDWVCVFACFRCAVVEWRLVIQSHVVHGD